MCFYLKGGIYMGKLILMPALAFAGASGENLPTKSASLIVTSCFTVLDLVVRVDHTVAPEALMVVPADSEVPVDLSDTVPAGAVSEVAFITAHTIQVFLAPATTASSLKRQATTKNQMFLSAFAIGGTSTRTNSKATKTSIRKYRGFIMLIYIYE